MTRDQPTHAEGDDPDGLIGAESRVDVPLQILSQTCQASPPIVWPQPRDKADGPLTFESRPHATIDPAGVQETMDEHDLDGGLRSHGALTSPLRVS